jgi:ribA/ribD-fused uncharacterized protein
MPITVYKLGEYAGFLNISRHGFNLDGYKWKTVEHYFQASKYVHIPQYYNLIKNCSTPNKAIALGLSLDIHIRKDWESVKEDVVRSALLAKFKTHVALSQLLVKSGFEMIIVSSENDSYWGVVNHKNGYNRLGVLLMELRNILQLEQCDVSVV